MSVAAKWDVYAAELADTSCHPLYSAQKRPCIYCEHPTKALSQVCLAHADLVKLDPGYPSPGKAE